MTEVFNDSKIDKEFKVLSVINACKLNGVESCAPVDERDVVSMDSKRTSTLYIEALKNNTAVPVFVGIPHAGEFVPQEILNRVVDPKIFTEGLDAGTAYIFSPQEDGKSLAIKNNISRVVTDPNRKPDQFELGMGVGGGTVTWTRDLQEQPMYKTGQEPSADEMKKNVKDYYEPYYRGLHSLIGSLHEKMGYKELLFLDGHSFPGTIDVPKLGVVGSDPKPMFILGSQGNTKASEEVMNWFVEALKQHAPSREDFPDMYKHISETAFADSRRGWGGFHNVEYFGHPNGIQNETSGNENNDSDNLKIHAIQVEMNMSAFYDDGKYDRKNLEALRQTVQKAIEEVGDKLKNRN